MDVSIGLGLGQGWKIFPAGGATGEAYIAQYEGQNKLFLKRNSSPFLAVLSAEKIVPKLIWTKRMENGDVITAQHWLNGRELKPVDMASKEVAMLLSKIHRSKELVNMLQRLGKKQFYPSELLSEVKRKSSEKGLLTEPTVMGAIRFLEQELQFLESYEWEACVCHCDLNHNNWMLSENQELYLIDWDGAMIADPALDIGSLLYCYIKKEDWNTWLSHYGVELTADLERRMRWYMVYQTILSIMWHMERNDENQQHLLPYLKDLIS